MIEVLHGGGLFASRRSRGLVLWMLNQSYCDDIMVKLAPTSFREDFRDRESF